MKNLAATVAAGVALALAPLAAHAQEPMVLCVEDQPASPYTFPTRDGTMQVLVKMAAKQADIPVVLKVQPWKRCIDDVRSDEAGATEDQDLLGGERVARSFHHCAHNSSMVHERAVPEA